MRCKMRWVCLMVAVLVLTTTAEHCDPIPGNRQSPINIDPTQAIPKLVRPFSWSAGYREILDGATLLNDGHTLKLSVVHKTSLQLSGGTLHVPYELQQLHFHWGDTDQKGSEHKIANYAYPLEMHVVHSQSTSNNTDEMVVVAYFFRISQRINRGLQNILDYAITAAENRNVPINIQPFKLSDLLGTGLFSYFTYKGSLTTPPYSESVTWIIASTALPISKYQLEMFRKAAQVDAGLLNNFRCLQKLNGRRVNFHEPVRTTNTRFVNSIT